MRTSLLICRTRAVPNPTPAGWIKRWLVAAALAAECLFPLSARGTEAPSLVVTTTVDAVSATDNLTSLREALNYAQSLGGTQIVTFAPSLAGQTVWLSDVASTTAGLSALGISAPLNVTIDGGVGGVTIARLPAAQNMRLFVVQQNARLALKSVTLMNGVAKGHNSTAGGGSAGLGGAIFNLGTLELQQVTMTANQAVGGNAVAGFGSGGAGLLFDSTNVDGGGPNGAAGATGTGGSGQFGGGGGAGAGTGGRGGAGGFGGGGALGNDFGGAGGFGGGGGGALTTSGTPGAAGFGGGAGAGGTGVVGGGGAGFGGAVFNYGGTIRGTNVTLSGNTALGGTGAHSGAGYGGAIFNLNGNVRLIQATVANNGASAGAIYNVGDNGVNFAGGPALITTTPLAAPATVALSNTILAGTFDSSTSAPALDYQQVNWNSGSGSTGFAASGGAGNLLQRPPVSGQNFGGLALVADPLLGPLANYGGPTPTQALRPGSPALDAGLLILSPGSDQRGQPRPATGLRGRYYQNANAQPSLLSPISNLEAKTPATVQTTPIIDFGAGTEITPGDGSPSLRGASSGNLFGGIGVNVGFDDLAAIWDGYITIPENANYRFATASDDGSVLFIDGQLVVNNNFSQGTTLRSGDIALTPGVHAIKIGYFEGGGGASMQAFWQQLDGPHPFVQQIIPSNVLSPNLPASGAQQLPDIGAFEALDTAPPDGGNFALLPEVPAVKAGTLLTAVFTGWTDASPISYEVSDGATVIVPAGSDTAPNFILPPGVHTISGRVVDQSGYAANVGPVTITVDGQAPQIWVPDDITLFADIPEHGFFNFPYSVTDDLDPDPTVTVNPPSGSFFPEGTTTVTVTAQDAAGNYAQASFHITVVRNYVAHDKLFTRDGAVPGAGEPGSGIEEDMLFTSFGVPAINSKGNMALLAKKHIGNVKYNDITFHRGARDASSGLPTGKRLARVGEAVPGFSDLVWATLKDPLIAEDGSVLVLGTVKSVPPAPPVPPAEKTVLMRYAMPEGGAPQLVARTGMVLGAAGDARLKSILSMAMARDGVVAFAASLVPGSGIDPVVTANTDRAVLTWTPAQGRFVQRLREGFSPGGTLPAVKSFKTLMAGPNTPAMGRGWLMEEELPAGAGSPQFAFHLRVQAAFVDSTSADLSIDLTTGLPTALFANGPQGTELSNIAGARLKTLGLPAAGARDDTALIRAVPAAGAAGLFRREGVFATPLVRVGDPAPQISGAIFKAFGDPVVSGDGSSAAFLGKLSGSGISPLTDTALYWSQDAGQPPTLIAREGGFAPETDGGVFKTFNSFAAPGGGRGPILLAKLAVGPGGVTTANDAGLWATDGYGGLRLLLREGVTTIGNKTVKSFKTLMASAGSPGVTRNFNAAGEIVVSVTFTDTTTAVLVMRMPVATGG